MKFVLCGINLKSATNDDILNAEEVSFNKVPPLSVIYDEYGFVNNKENTKNK